MATSRERIIGGDKDQEIVDPRLRAYLGRVRIGVRQRMVEKGLGFSFSTSDLRRTFADVFRMSLEGVGSLYSITLNRRIVEFGVGSQGDNFPEESPFKADEETLMAFAAVGWINKRGRVRSRNGGTDWRETIAKLKAMFAPDSPIGQRIKMPTNQGQQRSPNILEQTDLEVDLTAMENAERQAVSFGQRTPLVRPKNNLSRSVFGPEKVLGVNERVVLAREAHIRRKIPRVELADLTDLDLAGLERLHSTLRNVTDSVDQRILSNSKVKTIMFVSAVDRHRVGVFDPEKDDYSERSVKAAVLVSLNYFRKLPQLRQYGQFFDIVREKYLKEPLLYWRK